MPDPYHWERDVPLYLMKGGTMPIHGRRGPETQSRGNALDSVDERQAVIDSRTIGDKKGCSTMLLIVLATVLLVVPMLACAGSTYSYGVDTAPTADAKEVVREALNEASGIVPVGTLIHGQ